MTLEVQAAIEAAAHAIWVFAQMEPEDYSEIEKIITRHVAPHLAALRERHEKLKDAAQVTVATIDATFIEDEMPGLGAALRDALLDAEPTE